MNLNFGNILKPWSITKPNGIALLDGQKTMSFKELDTYSDRLANHLKSLGVKKGDLIIIYSHKELVFIMSVFAIMKAGAAYVPLDPNNPKTRIEGIIEEVQPKVVFGKQEELLPLNDNIPFIELNTLIHVVKNLPAEVFSCNLEPDDLCYVMYTSGSTGIPKGVQITHKNMMAFFWGMKSVFLMDENSRCLNTLPYHFDGCIVDTFYPLYMGASVYITPSIPIPSTIINIIYEQNITHMTAVMSILKLLSETFLKSPEKFQSVDYIMTGAEACDIKVVNNMISTFPDLKIINGYGPTEATCDSITYTISKDNLISNENLGYPIGKPLPYITALLADVDNKKIGELLLSGDQVFKSYLKRKEETVEAFRTINGVQYYKTGDLCKLDKHGNYLFIGRKDDEVKINAYRIHLNEIKNAMMLNTNIKSCIIHVFNQLKEKSICVFFDSKITFNYEKFESLRNDLLKILPSYMLPKAFVQVQEWPLLASHKLDKKSLVKELITQFSVSRELYYIRSNEQITPIINSNL